MYRYNVLLYTTGTDGWYFFVHKLYTAIHPTNYTPLWCTNYGWISCTAVHLYCIPVYVELILTNEIPSKITFMNHVNQSQVRFLGVLPPWQKMLNFI